MEAPRVPEITGLDCFQIKMNNISASTSCPWPSTIARMNTYKLILKAGECDDRDDWAQCVSRWEGV
jgi:hypothetical protein